MREGRYVQGVVVCMFVFTTGLNLGQVFLMHDIVLVLGVLPPFWMLNFLDFLFVEEKEEG